MQSGRQDRSRLSGCMCAYILAFRTRTPRNLPMSTSRWAGLSTWTGSIQVQNPRLRYRRGRALPLGRLPSR